MNPDSIGIYEPSSIHLLKGEDVYRIKCIQADSATDLQLQADKFTSMLPKGSKVESAQTVISVIPRDYKTSPPDWRYVMTILWVDSD